MAALRGARRHTDYLIDRARQLFPPTTPDAKVKALNYLLPHIRQMPSRIARDEFAADAAQKLQVDSALLREELRQAAARRRDQLPTAVTVLSEAERTLVRALAGHPDDQAFRAAAAALDVHPDHIRGLATEQVLLQLRRRASADSAGLSAPVPDPLEAVPDPEHRRLLAQVLLGELAPLDPGLVQGALDALHHRHLENRQRELRAAIAAAERSGDTAAAVRLTLERTAVDRALRAL